jgi:hypothetical protein
MDEALELADVLEPNTEEGNWSKHRNLVS